ncbi:hydroxyethylthiazole kinase [Teichococcus vastitatis]|uniref:hydroxyethylthiazole kinase n=1 Tax=Teichococcus vastitatis TaxID=2307076 RepID=UPI000E719A2B|nr:hydroxyethylthiazole kinase [Pseudoroseomonas vastitatis]
MKTSTGPELWRGGGRRLLAIGASPAKVQVEQEAEEFLSHAAALVIDIGTLMAPQRAAMHLAAKPRPTAIWSLCSTATSWAESHRRRGSRLTLAHSTPACHASSSW